MNSRLQAQLSSALHVGRASLRLAAPFVDLWTRLCLAEAFLLSGLLKAGNWPAALELARYEYPVSWLNAETAALLGAGIEIAGSIFLVLGLLARAAAFTMLFLSLVIQFSYRQLDVNLFWAALFGWYVVNGAGPLSFDRMMAKGLANSPLPLAAQIIATAKWFGRTFGPWYMLLLRLWLAASIAGMPLPSAWFLVATLSSLPVVIAWPAALLLVIGAATPLVAGLLLLGLSGMWMMQAAETASFYAALLFAMLMVFGAGHLSIDRLIFEHLRRPAPRPDDGEPHVVIVGAGFGGMACAARLRHERIRIALIDRRNYHLFQPLLYQVATASLSPADIAAPIRAIFRDDARVSVIRATVTGIDPVRQMVLTDGPSFSYDYLVLATGASHGYFGNDHWAPHAPGLKFVEDALAMRSRILAAFEQAETTDDEAEPTPPDLPHLRRRPDGGRTRRRDR